MSDPAKYVRLTAAHGQTADLLVIRSRPGVLVLAAFSNARPGEIVSLSWPEHPDNSRWKVRRRTGDLLILDSIHPAVQAKKSEAPKRPTCPDSPALAARQLEQSNRALRRRKHEQRMAEQAAAKAERVRKAAQEISRPLESASVSESYGVTGAAPAERRWPFTDFVP